MLFSSQTSSRTLALLQWECANLNLLLNVSGSAAGQALLDSSGEFIRVLGMPLPAGYSPACCDLVLIVSDFPASPPIGLYLLNSDRGQVEKIKTLFGKFHVFRNEGQYGAPSIPGYTWICYHYQGNQWCYRADAPAQGDNLRKFLQGFYAELAAGVRR
jgi:hypothetical protein